MTEDGGRFWIDLGADGSSSDKVTANSYGNQRINMALSGTAAGTYTVFDGGTGLTDKDMVHLELYMNRGLSVDESTGVSIENGVVKVTITGTASSEVYTLTWDGTDGGKLEQQRCNCLDSGRTDKGALLSGGIMWCLTGREVLW